MTPCRHPAFTTERTARRRAWALEPNPALRKVAVKCPYGCGAWRLENPTAPTNETK